jgi:hypothetical protein
VHDAGRLGTLLAAEDAVPQAEVEGRPDHDDEVGGVERLAAGLGDEERVAARDHAAAHAVGDRGEAGGLHQLERLALGPVGPDVGAEDQQRPLGVRDQPGDPVERVGVGVGAPRRRGRGEGAGRGVEELVHRDVDEDGSTV